MSKRKTKKLKELISFQKKGITPSYSEFGQKTILVLNQKCNRNFSINLDFASYNDLTKKKVASDLVLRHGDILINSTGKGTLGRVAQYFGTAQQVTVDSHMLIMRPTEELDTTFFGYALKQYQEILMSKGIGSSGQEELDKISLNEISISYPSDKEEQKNIAAILTALDTKISINKKLNDNLEALAQALYDYWFVQFDFPDENGKPYKSSGGKMVWNEELKREIPVGWHAVRLSDTCHVNASTYREKEAWRMVKYIDTSNLTNNVIGKIETFDLKIDKLPSRARRKIQDADVLFSTVRPIQCHYGLMLNPEPNLLVSTGFVVLSAIRNIISPYLVFCIVSSQSIVQDMQQKAETGTSSYPSIRPEHLGDVIVPLPKERKEIMTYFEDIVEPLYRKIDMIHRNTRQLAEQRDFLLPLLMSGQVKVGEKENVVSCQPTFIR